MTYNNDCTDNILQEIFNASSAVESGESIK